MNILAEVCNNYLDGNISEEIIRELDSFCEVHDFFELGEVCSLSIGGKYPNIEFRNQDNNTCKIQLYGDFDLACEDLYFDITTMVDGVEKKFVQILNSDRFVCKHITFAGKIGKVQFVDEIRKSQFEDYRSCCIRYFDDSDNMKLSWENLVKYSKNNVQHKIFARGLFNKVLYQRAEDMVYHFQNIDDMYLKGIFVQGDYHYLEQCLSKFIVDSIKKDYNIEYSHLSIILQGVVDDALHQLEISLEHNNSIVVKYRVDDIFSHISYSFLPDSEIENICTFLKGKSFYNSFIEQCIRELLYYDNIRRNHSLFTANNSLSFDDRFKLDKEYIFEMARKQSNFYRSCCKDQKVFVRKKR